ncbi:conserved hypothetical protein [Mesorhizobium metallidurans STM 2683]|uniref:Serine protease n=1 Tax=Mesorhizobium metallidurans STM 2683 TaxID=1297569 RepID=M5EUF4_9HYPH|nr:hypothetical protein [Mesorhizobium metallidurans]CCV03321.1 conserved hypothetical protein [Mesorhizobium metallidurans STM 2683]
MDADNSITPPISILKSLWSRTSDGRWAITNLKGIDLKPQAGFGADYFAFESELELMTSRPSMNITELMATFGPTDFLLKQSILPVVAWKEGETSIRCVGTASVISCSGYVITAAHVLMDPYDSGYGAVRRGNQLAFADQLNFGVIIPLGPGYGFRGFRFFPFEKFWLWGSWKETPLLHESDRFEFLTDIAICKIPEMPGGAAHQPLGLSLNAFVPAEAAYSLGYAEMEDIPLEYGSKGMSIKEFRMDLYVSIGEVMRIFPRNHLDREVPTPGPCFDFKAKIPGKMSGAPVFGAEGVVVRGVVSRSFSGERHAFGAMLGPAMHLALDEPSVKGRTLRTLMETGNEGIARIQGAGL